MKLYSKAEVCDKLQDYLRKNKLTQVEFARQVGSIAGSVCHAISGRRPPTRAMLDVIGFERVRESDGTISYRKFAK